jgi:hypothetical protein
VHFREMVDACTCSASCDLGAPCSMLDARCSMLGPRCSFLGWVDSGGLTEQQHPSLGMIYDLRSMISAPMSTYVLSLLLSPLSQILDPRLSASPRPIPIIPHNVVVTVPSPLVVVLATIPSHVRATNRWTVVLDLRPLIDRGSIPHPHPYRLAIATPRPHRVGVASASSGSSVCTVLAPTCIVSCVYYKKELYPACTEPNLPTVHSSAVMMGQRSGRMTTGHRRIDARFIICILALSLALSLALPLSLSLAHNLSLSLSLLQIPHHEAKVCFPQLSSLPVTPPATALLPLDSDYEKLRTTKRVRFVYDTIRYGTVWYGAVRRGTVRYGEDEDMTRMRQRM